METSKETFYALARSESAIVDSIIDAMMHTKKNEAKDFLTVMNSVIDYYLSRTSDDGQICYPIIHVPHAPEWAREVLLKFLIFKLSLYYNSDTRHILDKESHKQVYLRTDEDHKHYSNYVVPCRKYIKALLRNLTEDFVAEPGHKNIIFCSENDIRVSREDKNKFIEEFYGAVDDIFTAKNIIMCQNLDDKGIRTRLKEHKEEGDVYIDNAFVFYTNNDKVNSLELTALERWNRAYHVGLKNCFVFDFSDEPFRLRRVMLRGATLCKKFPMILDKEFLRYRHFITFDEEETNFLFKWDVNYMHHLVDDDQLMFSDVLGALLDEAEYRIQERNRFALCLSRELMFVYQRYLKNEYEDYNDEDYQMSFEWQKEMVNTRITPILNGVMHKFSFSSTPHTIAVVIDKSTPQDFKTELSHYLQTINPKTKIKYYDYSALKCMKSKNKNGIRESIVIVLQYRPHYIKESYAKYPNSFDPYVVNKGQYIFDLIQGFAFNDMYAWDKYDYDVVLHDLMSCAYRDECIEDYTLPIKPSVRRITGEAEFSDERSNKTTVAYVKGIYENGQSFSIPETEYIIYEQEGSQYINRLSELKENGKLQPLMKIQRLDEVAENLKAFRTEEADKREKVIRTTYYKQAKITKEEYHSSIALWKILLAKTVRVEGFEKVYQAINAGLKGVEYISIGQLKSWIDISDDNMMLPRSKAHQLRLFEFLGFGTTSPYWAVMRSMKATAKNNTRSLNTMIDRFLLLSLTNPIDEEMFYEIYNSDVNDLLDIHNIGDLESLVAMLREEIKFNTIKEIY